MNNIEDFDGHKKLSSVSTKCNMVFLYLILLFALHIWRQIVVINSFFIV